MRNFIVATFMLFLQQDIVAQIKLKSTESLRINSENNVRMKTMPKVLTSNLSGDAIDFLQKNPNLFSAMSQHDEVLWTNNKIVFTYKYNPSDIQSVFITTYKIINNTTEENGSKEFRNEIVFSPFPDGSFATIENDEGGGQSMELYSKDFNLVKRYIPFESGYDRLIFSNYNDLLLTGAAPNDRSNFPSLALFKNNGQLLFKINLSKDEEISSVLCSQDYFAVYVFSHQTSSNAVAFYDKTGRQLWKTTLDSMVEKWKILEGKSPSVIIGTRKRLYLLDSKSGAVLDEVDLNEIYSEAGLNKFRNDNYIEIAGIDFIDGCNGVILSEPLGENDFKNVILFSFSDHFKKQRQVFKLGDFKSSPLLKKTTQQFMIIKDNEIVKYGY